MAMGTDKLSKKPQTRVAVLMTCYNRVQVTLRCLRVLFEQELPLGCVLDVWLVDDASPDETGNLVQQAYKQVHVIKSCGGLFWCKGMRLAWDAAASTCDYDFYLWLNDDVFLKRDALKIAFSDYQEVASNRPAVIVGSFSSDESERDVSYCATKATGGRDFPDGRAPKLANGFLNGNFVLIPRKVFRDVGPIYNGYHHAFGDYDYSMMLRRWGYDFYSTSRFLGVCPQQPQRYGHLKNRTLRERLSLLRDPKGYSLHDTFLFRYRNWGLIRALISCAHVFCKVVVGKE